MTVELDASIKGITYKSLLYRPLKRYSLSDLSRALETESSFIYDVDSDFTVAVSCWVTPKRTRSYPFARVYNSLSFSGKSIAVIPAIKDEGKRGDRDYIQWDTIALLGLLGVYVILAYYDDAEISTKYSDKITNQRFNIQHVFENMLQLKFYRSSALHWNLEQLDNLSILMAKAKKSYSLLAHKLGVEFHSEKGIDKRIAELEASQKQFVKDARLRAQQAQRREVSSIQPKEKQIGEKASVTISDHVGGFYYLTADDHYIDGNRIYLIESKHSKAKPLPSIDDVKEGLIKICLFSNLTDVLLDTRHFVPVPKLRLTSGIKTTFDALRDSDKKVCEALIEEAKSNKFELEFPFDV